VNQVPGWRKAMVPTVLIRFMTRRVQKKGSASGGTAGPRLGLWEFRSAGHRDRTKHAVIHSCATAAISIQPVPQRSALSLHKTVWFSGSVSGEVWEDVVQEKIQFKLVNSIRVGRVVTVAVAGTTVSCCSNLFWFRTLLPILTQVLHIC
jgi:hypothetical protein